MILSLKSFGNSWGNSYDQFTGKYYSIKNNISEQFRKNFKGAPFYDGLAKTNETFNNVFNLVWLSNTGIANITDTFLYVLLNWPMQESLKRNSKIDGP